jgi:aryl-alcohol dehydrogenase-like predicted oxidoreductase
MSMSQAYGRRDDDESIRTIQRALDLGISFFDTAAVYGDGHNETLVGRGLGARRCDIVLATKCGILRPPGGEGFRLDGSPAHILWSCDESLQRLGTDVIDLFYLQSGEKPALPH